MTSFLTAGMAGIGAAGPPSTDTRALQDINSQNKTFANKDFVKNIAWLNNSVDMLSMWSQKLQSGVDQANQNALEQVQGIYADLFVMFAGLEPTGIDVGDLKYVLQGLGALLGINPDTPFPVNLFEAAWHLFSQYIIPTDQFTDVIFDAIEAWAVDFGLSPEFMTSLGQLRDSFETLSASIGTSMEDLFTALSKLLSAFMPSLDSLGPIWDGLSTLIDGIDTSALKPVIQLLADLGVPFINALTAIVNAGNSFLTPLSFISGSQIATLGTNVAPPVGTNTTQWSVGAAGAQATAWVWDATENAFTTTGNGVYKEIHTQTTYKANPGQKFTIKGSLKWTGIPSGANDFGIQLQWYMDANPVSVSNCDIPAGHGSTGAWAASINAVDVVVPQNVNGFKIAARVGTGITSGTVWAKDISAQLQGGISTGMIDGLESLLSGFLPLDFFNGLGGMANPTPTDLFGYFESFLTGDSPLDLGNAFGLLGAQHIPLISLSAVSNTAQNFLVNPSFDNANSIFGGGVWFWDELVGAAQPGSVYTDAAGIVRELVSNRIDVAQGQTANISIKSKWDGLVYAGTQPIKVDVNGYLGNNMTPVRIDNLAGPTTPAAVQDWTTLGGTYPIPAGIDNVRIRLYVSDFATAGRIRFDDGSYTLSNLLPQNFVSGLLDSFTSVSDLLGLKLPIADHQNLLNALAGLGSGANLSNIISRLTGLTTGGFFDSSKLTNLIAHPAVPNTAVPGLNDISDFVTQALVNPSSTGNPLSAILTNMSDMLDNIRQGADGTPSTGAVIGDLFQSFNGLRQSITSNSIGLQQIQQVMPSIGGQGGGGGTGVTGNNFQDNCERAAASGYGPGWLTIGPAGAVTSDGHRWNWNDSGGSVRNVIGIYTAGQTLSDYQSVKDVMSSLMESPQAWTGAGPAANNWLVGRANVTGTRFTMLARFYNRVELYDYNAGVFTLIPRSGGGSGSISMTPVAGSRWELECGNALSNRIFTAYMNDGVVGVWADTGNVTAIGAAQRYAGQAMMSDARSGGEATPGSIDLWSVSDKEPPSPTTVIGSGTKICRLNTGSITLGTTAAETVLPANVFDFQSSKSADMTVDLVNGKVTVQEDGWYAVAYRAQTNAYSGDADTLVYKGQNAGAATLLEYGETYTAVPTLKGTWEVYLRAGEWIQVGYKLSAAGTVSCTGDSVGAKTWLKVTLLNRSLL